MKYLKLFENFQGEDPKWILTSVLDPIEVVEVPFDDKYGDTSMFQLFELSEFPNQENLDHLESWLKEEGYYYKLIYSTLLPKQQEQRAGSRKTRKYVSRRFLSKQKGKIHKMSINRKNQRRIKGEINKK